MPIYSKTHAKLARYEVPNTNIQQLQSGCCVGVSCCCEAAVSEECKSIINENVILAVLNAQYSNNNPNN